LSSTDGVGAGRGWADVSVGGTSRRDAAASAATPRNLEVCMLSPGSERTASGQAATTSVLPMKPPRTHPGHHPDATYA
jgi:hypothetical protein